MSLLLDNVSYNYPGSTHGLHEVSIDVRTAALPHLRPISRFAAKTVFSALVIACRFAM